MPMANVPAFGAAAMTESGVVGVATSDELAKDPGETRNDPLPPHVATLATLTDIVGAVVTQLAHAQPVPCA